MKSRRVESSRDKKENEKENDFHSRKTEIKNSSTF